MELGLTSFAESPTSGENPSQAERLRQIVDEIVLAEQVGLDVYGLGEHHRPDFASSSPAVALAAAAGKTERIRLFPAVSVLSTDDPVRVFQQYATLDAVSSGRAELLVGRGSFIESFPLFGYSLHDYDELFTEKLDLLLKIRDNEKVTWSGKFRTPLEEAGVYPRPERPLPIRIGVGGTPQSIVRAASRGLPVALAIIGGAPERFRALTALYIKTLIENGHDPADFPLSVHAHGFVAENDQEAADIIWPSYSKMMTKIGRERGWPPVTREQFDWMWSPEGSLVLGSPENVAEKILRWKAILGIDRFELHVSGATIDTELVHRNIELFGTKVGPLVRAG